VKPVGKHETLYLLMQSKKYWWGKRDGGTEMGASGLVLSKGI